ncbi:Uncharacterised protein [Mycobacteroides abscessus subsp. abscessus]|nr:Uncharacterised protein [Mycobacteroides abscessus subsp. abscessus]SIA88479.1 Uncharacterised protein [Mycobacteroides abscessus subsp. abscessus]SIC65268.1 Uncharacterised protein [Mycobacteroides abscessus subsp. abscessus]SID78813.1 Uncharacterised protein [Mycobacteroides abscessus subsp. abscessus]
MRSTAPGRPLVRAAATSAAAPERSMAVAILVNPSAPSLAPMPARRAASEPNAMAAFSWNICGVSRLDASWS